MIAAGDEPLLPASYGTIPVAGPPTDRNPADNGDLNLALRSYVTVTAALELIDLDGPVDQDAPQLRGLFGHAQVPEFTRSYQVHDWAWECQENGCRGEPLAEPEVTLLEVATTPGESVDIPLREQEIYDGAYKAMVLYAEAKRITFVYTRHDSPAFGYVVHLEDFQVEPTLLLLYQQADSEGREYLPALRNGDRVGTADGTSIKIAIRDTGRFMDPRSRKDWWQGY